MFKKQGKLKRVNAKGTIDEIFTNVEKIFKTEKVVNTGDPEWRKNKQFVPIIGKKPKIVFIMGGPGSGKGT